MTPVLRPSVPAVAPCDSDPEVPDVPPPHRPLPPGEVPTPILPDPGQPAPIVPDPLPDREPYSPSGQVFGRSALTAASDQHRGASGPGT